MELCIIFVIPLIVGFAISGKTGAGIAVLSVIVGYLGMEIINMLSETGIIEIPEIMLAESAGVIAGYILAAVLVLLTKAIDG